MIVWLGLEDPRSKGRCGDGVALGVELFVDEACSLPDTTSLHLRGLALHLWPHTRHEQWKGGTWCTKLNLNAHDSSLSFDRFGQYFDAEKIKVLTGHCLESALVDL